jgi:hypothetical protein
LLRRPSLSTLHPVVQDLQEKNQNKENPREQRKAGGFFSAAAEDVAVVKQ